MRKRFVIIALATALGLVGIVSAAGADPQPGSNNGNSFVCNGNNADPPPCPGK